MALIRFVTKQGQDITLEGDSGSVMELAVLHGVPGIDGDCGGVCSCATCHVHVANGDLKKTGEASDFEQEMLALTEDVKETSRLCCQLLLSDDLDGITLHLVR